MQMVKEVAGVSIPDTALAVKAWKAAEAAQPPFMFRHGLRSYVFGAMAAEKIYAKIDHELALIAALMHDVGLTPEYFSDDQRFEIDGADFARRWALENGLSEDKAERIWDAIALHSTLQIPLRKSPEAAIVHLGAGVDVIGFGVDAIPKVVLEAVVEAVPRLSFKKAFEAALAEYVKKKPSIQIFSFTSSIAERHCHGFQAPKFEELMQAAPFLE